MIKINKLASPAGTHMKKILLSLLVLFCLLGAPVVHAESNTPEQVQELRIQIIQLITQLIALLQQQLQVAIDQQSNLGQTNQTPASNVAPQSIQENDSNLQIAFGISGIGLTATSPDNDVTIFQNTVFITKDTNLNNISFSFSNYLPSISNFDNFVLNIDGQNLLFNPRITVNPNGDEIKGLEFNSLNYPISSGKNHTIVLYADLPNAISQPVDVHVNSISFDGFPSPVINGGLPGAEIKTTSK